VLRPLSVPLPLAPFILIPESRGAGGGAGLRPAAGRFAGGAGGVGLERMADPLAPLAFAGAGGGGGGVGLMTGAAGGGGGASSFRYADGAQPWPVGVLASHHPLFSFWMMVIRSPAFSVISLALWPAKSYNTLYWGSRGAAGGAGGGGGGIARPEDVEEVFLVWLGIGVGL